MMTISFLVFLLLFLLVGVASVFRSKNNKQDYYLASRCVAPWLVGLSAVATNNSGYMFIGVIFISLCWCAMVAGGKALHVLLSWPQWWGALLSAGLTLLYCLAGGIRASIWTDAAQSVVMIVAMSILLVTALMALGGTSVVMMKMSAIDGFLVISF